MTQQPKYKLDESLRSGDLENFVSEVFNLDRYKSKMGEDKDVLVLGFKVKDKAPAIDLMEFIEKGYDFVLDADMSAGEEYDGLYQVFVEIERTPQLAEQLQELLGGVAQLCNCKEWRYVYQTDSKILEFNKDTISNHVPMTAEAYSAKVLSIKENDIRNFFDKGAVELNLTEDNNIIFNKPYSGSIHAKFVAIGNYDIVKTTLPGRLSLDEASQSQVLFLTKYLGNYDIDKIGDKFLIKNGDKAIVIEKDRW